MPEDGSMRASSVVTACWGSLPFSTWRARAPAIFFLPRSARSRRRVDQHDVEAGGGRDLRDAAAHLARAQDADALDLVEVCHAPTIPMGFYPRHTTLSVVLAVSLGGLAGCAHASSVDRAQALVRQHREPEAVASLRVDLARHPYDVPARRDCSCACSG